MGLRSGCNHRGRARRRLPRPSSDNKTREAVFSFGQYDHLGPPRKPHASVLPAPIVYVTKLDTILLVKPSGQPSEDHSPLALSGTFVLPIFPLLKVLSSACLCLQGQSNCSTSFLLYIFFYLNPPAPLTRCTLSRRRSQKKVYRVCL